mgnify:CR=1 FL=1
MCSSDLWMLGLQWKDAFVRQNVLGLAVGQPLFVTSLRDGSNANDSTLIWEGWYEVKVSDAIAVMPALFYLSRPLGQATPAGRSFNQVGALLKTSFSF